MGRHLLNPSECMAGTTGLEPATSAVTVKCQHVTDWKQEDWMAPSAPCVMVANSYLCPYRARALAERFRATSALQRQRPGVRSWSFALVHDHYQYGGSLLLRAMRSKGEGAGGGNVSCRPVQVSAEASGDDTRPVFYKDGKQAKAAITSAHNAMRLLGRFSPPA